MTNKFKLIGSAFVVSLLSALSVSGVEHYQDRISVIDAKTLYSNYQQQENLDNIGLNFTDHNKFIYFYEHNKMGHTVNIGPILDSANKIFHPFEEKTVSSKEIHESIILHEVSHAYFKQQIFSKGKLAHLELDAINFNDKSSADTITNKINNYIINKKGWDQYRILLDENFADSYSAILMIRNNKFSQTEVRKIVQARYDERKFDAEVNPQQLINDVFKIDNNKGADLSHRTANSLKQILNLNFEEINSLSSQQAFDLALNIAAKSTMIEFKQFYKDLATNKNFTDGINPEDVQLFVEHVDNMNIELASSSTKKAVGVFNVNNMKKIREAATSKPTNSLKFS